MEQLKKNGFKWNDAAKHAFQILKEAMTQVSTSSAKLFQAFCY